MTCYTKRMKTTKVGQRYQVVIPKEIRNQLKLKPGERLKVELMGNTVVMERYSSEAEQWYGKQKTLWANIDALAYLKEERSTWREQ